jgi:hypothetical protein
LLLFLLCGAGLAFAQTPARIPDGGSATVAVGAQLGRIYLRGMTSSGRPRGWSDPNDGTKHFFVGDELGRIRLDYADGTRQVYPLLLGEGIWWGRLFQDYREPFDTDPEFRAALAGSLRLFPAAPLPNPGPFGPRSPDEETPGEGGYVAVIVPQAKRLASMTFIDSPRKVGTPVILGVAFEAANSEPSETWAKSARLTPLRRLGEDEAGASARMERLRRALYSTEDDYLGSVPVEVASGYSGPRVSFRGNISAQILTNAFYANVQDIRAKIDSKGLYHTSTKGALSWGGYNGFGTFRPEVSRYFGDSFSRDLGRSLQEVTALGFTDDAARCADECLRLARIWEERATKIKGVPVPRHWGQVINHPGNGCFENDGHGLMSVWLHRLWQRLPDRDRWLRTRWTDIKAAGDWILWQFDHPEVSGATDCLHTTGESAGGKGYSVFPDCVCMDALQALAQMADSIGDAASAARWRERAERMRRAIGERYIVTDPKYGRVWTLKSSGWPNRSTVLGPLIFLADTSGLLPQDDDPAWRPANEAAYQRIIDAYRPFGFYGQAMGYGQGFVTESALLLDRMGDATRMLDWAARQIYDPRWGSFITPEGCEIDPTGRYWYRMGDLGNGVQEGEIVKVLRLVIGVDDTQPGRPRIVPRLPNGWSGISIDDYPMLVERGGKPELARIHYRLERAGSGMQLELSADREVGPVLVRLGPFRARPDGDARRSGDAWWRESSASLGVETASVIANAPAE